MKNWHISVVVVLALSALLVLFFFLSAEKSAPVIHAASTKYTGAITEPVDKGNEVYYFPVVDIEFAQSLSTFLQQHPDLRIAAIVEDHSGDLTMGYFVILQ